MQAALFVPCYIDQFFPDVGLATLELLEQHGVDVIYPEAQTCCGQPMANTGCVDDTRPLAEKFAEVFGEYEYTVCPSGSCVAMVRNHYSHLLSDTQLEKVQARTYELCEFLLEVVGVTELAGSFPYRVGLHQSCHGLRELRMGRSSERMEPDFSKPRQLLEMLDGIQLCNLQRADECCGFGGTFAVAEEAVSCMMGRDRVADHVRAGAEVLTAADMSCLMHMDGLIRRQSRERQALPELRVMHIAQILAGRPVPTGMPDA